MDGHRVVALGLGEGVGREVYGENEVACGL